MTDLGAIRLGFKKALDALNKDGDWIQVTAYVLASPSPPTIQVMPGEVMYDIANARGGDQMEFTLQAMVVANFDQAAQMKLDQLLADSGSLSVKQLVEADSSLGDVVDDLRVTRVTGYQVYALTGRGPVLGADWTVEVLTKSV